ncbi:unnamed protein product [Moneuplotes crassus]|uniref:Uncharacterized protein n=2 Tax=Euplotes crassus TaxID=5936 RepID=A0AAD1YA79_EUPCR|nr:unnamed protein product [Moneuplotes crassus]
MKKHQNRVLKKLVARTGPNSPVGNRSSIQKQIRKSKIKFEKQNSNYTVFSNNSAFGSSRDNINLKSLRNKKKSINSPTKINFHQYEDGMDAQTGLPQSNDGSFISIKTPNPRDIKNWESHMDDFKTIDRPKKSRHSKNPSITSGNTPYSIFLNVQPNTSISKNKESASKGNNSKLNDRKSLIKNKRRIRKSNLVPPNMFATDASGKLPDLKAHKDIQRGRSAARKRRLLSPNIAASRMTSIDSLRSPQPPRGKRSRIFSSNPAQNPRRPKIKKSGQVLHKNSKNPKLITFDLSKAKDLQKMRKLVGMQERIKNVKLTPLKGVVKNIPNPRRKKISRKKFSSTSNNTFYNMSSTKSRIRVNSIKKAIKSKQNKMKMEKNRSVLQGKTPPKQKMRVEEQKYDDEIKDDSLSTSSVSSIDDFTNDGSTNNIPNKIIIGNTMNNTPSQSKSDISQKSIPRSNVTNEEIAETSKPKKSLTMADRVKIHQMNNLAPVPEPSSKKIGSSRPSFVKTRKKSKLSRIKEMSPKSALKEELSKLGKIRKLLVKANKKRPKRRTKSSKAVKLGKRNRPKLRRDSTIKEEDPTPLKETIPMPRHLPHTHHNRPGLKYSMTLTQINNIFNIDELEDEEESSNSSPSQKQSVSDTKSIPLRKNNEGSARKKRSKIHSITIKK